MTSKERIVAALKHQQPDRIPVDFGGTAVTGVHVKIVAGLREHYGLKGGRLFTIAATRIAMETIKRPIPNTPMVGALTRITGLFPIEEVVEFLRYDFGKKFPPKVVEGNILAITRSYEEVQGE